MNSQHTMSKATLSSPGHTNDLVAMSFNVGVVGCGRWGAKHLETLLQLKHQGFIDGVYACDINPNRFDEIHPSVDGAFHNWMDMHQSVKLDLITIATSNSTHSLLGVAMLQQGLNVLVEKPLGASFEDVMLLCDTAKKSTGTLHSGYLLRYHPGVEFAKELIKDHSIGQVKSIRYTKYSARKKPINANVIENLASHAFALIPGFIDSNKSPLFPVSVTLKDGKPAPLATASQAKFHMMYTGQDTTQHVDVEVHVGWGQADRNQLTIEGTKQHIRLDFWEHESIECGTQKTGYRTIPTPHSISPLESQYKHILSNNQFSHVSTKDHLQTATLLDKATLLAQQWHLHNA
jgi:predicted dehydrogenase